MRIVAFTVLAGMDNVCVHPVELIDTVTVAACTVLMYNKDNSELQLLTPNYKELHTALERAKAILKICYSIRESKASIEECVEIVIDTCTWPELRSEVFEGEPTGKYLIPVDVQYNPWLRDILYETHEGVNNRKKPTTYITGELDTEQIAGQIRKLINK